LSWKTRETPTMCDNPLLDSKFYAFLQRIDEELAAETRAGGCRRCQGRLHRDRYRRKPRGGPRGLDQAYWYRLSFTCAICDKRHTPVSVRFLGRRIYLAAAVVLASALRSGLNDRRVGLPRDNQGETAATIRMRRAGAGRTERGRSPSDGRSTPAAHFFPVGNCCGASARWWS